MARSFKEQKEARKLARKAKQDAWAAHNSKHRPLSADQRKALPKPKEG